MGIKLLLYSKHFEYYLNKKLKLHYYLVYNEICNDILQMNYKKWVDVNPFI